MRQKEKWDYMGWSKGRYELIRPNSFLPPLGKSAAKQWEGGVDFRRTFSKFLMPLSPYPSLREVLPPEGAGKKEQ